MCKVRGIQCRFSHVDTQVVWNHLLDRLPFLHSVLPAHHISYEGKVPPFLNILGVFNLFNFLIICLIVILRQSNDLSCFYFFNEVNCIDVSCIKSFFPPQRKKNPNFVIIRYSQEVQASQGNAGQAVLIYCWISFANILLGTFSSIFIKKLACNLLSYNSFVT